MQSALPQEQERYTYADYKKWPEQPRYELIDGVAYMMSPSPTFGHQSIVLKLGRLLGDYLDGKPCVPAIAPLDVLFPEEGDDDDDVDTILQPDVVVVCDRSKYDMDGKVVGAPDLVIEVLSPRTTIRDFDIKKRKYERHGVREYWIVSTKARMISQYKLIDGKYEGVDVIEGRIESSVIEGFGFELGELFAVLDI